MAAPEICPYEPYHRGGVVRVLEHLWGDNDEKNDAYFTWKYVDNPHAAGLPGIVAVHDGEVVAFRGYFPVEVEVGEHRYGLLRPGDTCVHPSHRRTGLSVAMGRLAAEEFGSGYRLFLNLSCTAPSLPGYLRLGFLPVAPKYFLTRTTGPGLLRYLLASAGLLGSKAGTVRRSGLGAVTVSGSPRPDAMAVLARRRKSPEDLIVLARDASFFQWRYRSPRHHYLFYSLTDGDALRAFVVVGLSANGRRAYILDHAQVDRAALREVLSSIISTRRFDVVSMLRFGMHADMKAVLEQAGFSQRSAVRAIEKRMHGELPVLVRPVNREFDEADLHLGGLDVRLPSSWGLLPVASDAV